MAKLSHGKERHPAIASILKLQLLRGRDRKALLVTWVILWAT